ncbi:MAG TPA: hypothetical protein VGI35_06175, partial [Steroidobacteraceae bacterium]
MRAPEGKQPDEAMNAMFEDESQLYYHPGIAIDSEQAAARAVTQQGGANESYNSLAGGSGAMLCGQMSASASGYVCGMCGYVCGMCGYVCGMCGMCGYVCGQCGICGGSCGQCGMCGGGGVGCCASSSTGSQTLKVMLVDP